jgi:hypothetical protein
MGRPSQPRKLGSLSASIGRPLAGCGHDLKSSTMTTYLQITDRHSDLRAQRERRERLDRSRVKDAVSSLRL